MAMMAFHSDVAEMYEFTGAVQGMVRVVMSDMFKSDVLMFTHAQMAKAFDGYASVAAGTQPGKYGHVYEWRLAGNPAAQLWKHQLAGPLNNKVATFEWKASRQPILTPRERRRNPRDAMSLVPDDELAKLSGRRYIFRWKAPMMEFNLDTIIRPRWAKALFIPTGNPASPFRITKSPVHKTAGGRETDGAFTELWTEWWATQAEQVFDESIKKIVEGDIAQSVLTSARGTRVRPVKTLASIKAVTNPAAAMAAGRTMAETYLRTRAQSYRQLSRAIIEEQGL